MILTVTISDEGTESLRTQPQLTQSFSSDSRRPTLRGAPGDLGRPEWLLAAKGPCVQDAEEGSFYWVDGCTRTLTFQRDACVRNLMDYVYFDFRIPGTENG